MHRAIIVLVAAGLVLATPVLAANLKQVDKLARACDRGDAGSCRKLADIAMRDKDGDVRLAATKRIKDQAALARIARSTQGLCRGDCEAAIEAAVAQLTDQPTLAEIARTHFSSTARRTALANVTDQAALAVVAIAGSDWQVGEAAVARLDDEALLFKVVTDGGNLSTRARAASKLTDQSLLAQLATSQDDSRVREAALGQLSDPARIAEVVRSTEAASDDPEACHAATGAPNTYDLVIHAEALLKLPPALANQVALARVARTWCLFKRVRQAATKRLTDERVLAQIARSDADDDVREAALQRLPREKRAELEIWTSETALAAVVDPHVLSEIARTSGSQRLRLTALENLSDPAILKEIAATEFRPRDLRTRLKAYDRSVAMGGAEDGDLLVRIAATAQTGDSRSEMAGRLAKIRPQAVARVTLGPRVLLIAGPNTHAGVHGWLGEFHVIGGAGFQPYRGMPVPVGPAVVLPGRLEFFVAYSARDGMGVEYARTLTGVKVTIDARAGHRYTVTAEPDWNTAGRGAKVMVLFKVLEE